MAELKLNKLPDRKPVRLVLNISPELHRALDDYAAVYRQTYGADEPICELIPHMLDAFLSTDRRFLKLRGGLRPDQS